VEKCGRSDEYHGSSFYGIDLGNGVARLPWIINSTRFSQKNFFEMSRFFQSGGIEPGRFLGTMPMPAPTMLFDRIKKLIKI